jgi:hypothetical protein
MKKLVLLTTIAAAALSLAGAAQAGCWATVGISPLADDGYAVGKPWVVTVRVLQHGMTPMRDARPIRQDRADRLQGEADGEGRLVSGQRRLPDGRPLLDPRLRRLPRQGVCEGHGVRLGRRHRRVTRGSSGPAPPGPATLAAWPRSR